MTPRMTRRRVLQMAGALAAAEPFRTLAGPLVHSSSQPALQPETGARLYAVMHGDTPADTGIGVFVWRDEVWHQLQFLSEPQVRHIHVDPAGDQIFAAHTAKDNGAGPPMGYVEGLKIDGRSGSLLRAQVKALALSARCPQALALSPCGRLLAVVSEGGTFSLLPVSEAGDLGEVIAAHKHLALSMLLCPAMYIRFESSTRLQVQAGSNLFQYEFETNGLHFSGVAKKTILSPLQKLAKLPPGVKSYTTLPPRTS